MHDWTLVAIHMDWAAGHVRIELRNRKSVNVTLVAEKVSKLHVPRLQAWGPSVSINEVTGPRDIGGSKQLLIEVQSGDVIEIAADSFILPAED